VGCATEPTGPADSTGAPRPSATPTPVTTPAPTPSPAAPAPRPQPSTAELLTRAEALAATGRESYKDFIRALRADADASEVQVKARRAKTDLRGALDAYNEALDPLRDDEGLLPREHEGHEAVIQQTATFLVDLEKLAKD
tara:strand:- start:412 stop:831 length:420 start_codon:yes stop_codon:yes gene_type:complete